MLRHSVTRSPAAKSLESSFKSCSSGYTPDAKSMKNRHHWSNIVLSTIHNTPTAKNTRTYPLFRLLVGAVFTAIALYILTCCRKLVRYTNDTPYEATSIIQSIRKNQLDYLNQDNTNTNYGANRTGSLENCSESTSSWIRSAASAFLRNEDTDIPAVHNSISGIVHVSCQPIRYRIGLDSLERAAQARVDITVGILSNSGSDGPMRRQVIRHTWASNDDTLSSFTKDAIIQKIENTTRQAATMVTSAETTNTTPFIITRPGVFFLVAGPWDDKLSKEFETYRDLIWIDKAEVYDAEKSVLTYKTQSFASIVYTEMKRFEKDGYKWSNYSLFFSFTTVESIQDMITQYHLESNKSYKHSCTRMKRMLISCRCSTMKGDAKVVAGMLYVAMAKYLLYQRQGKRRKPCRLVFHVFNHKYPTQLLY